MFTLFGNSNRRFGDGDSFVELTELGEALCQPTTTNDGNNRGSAEALVLEARVIHDRERPV